MTDNNMLYGLYVLSVWMVSMKVKKDMIQRIFLILLIVTFFTFEYGSAKQNISHQSTFYVSPTDDVQSIIDEVSDYSVIHLLPGIYTEQLTIYKPLIISGSSKEKVRFVVTTDVNEPAITLSAQNIVLENLTIINQGPGIYTTGVRTIADNITIQYCSIEKTPVGLALWSSNNTIKNCVFTDCTDEGIVIISSSFKKADHNLIQQCVFTNNCDGIELQGSCYNTINDCLFEDNTHDGIDAICSGNDNNVISQCTIIDNAVHGIYFSSSAYNTIRDCIIADNTDENILFTPIQGNNVITNVSFSSAPSEIQVVQLSDQKTSGSIKQQLFDRIIDMFSSLRSLVSF